MRRRTILSCMVLAGTIAAVPAGGTSPAGAQVLPPDLKVVAGNFFGDASDEEFFYVPGTTPDALRTISNGGVPGGDATVTFIDYNVNATFRPVAGDFDGDGFDELLWYGPGGVADYIWHFSADGQTFTQDVVSIGGTYTPLVGNFNGDGQDDVFFYGPGTAPDALWLFTSGGGHVSVPVTVNGNYRAFVASIGKDATDDLVWYAPGTAADTVWDWTRLARTYTQFRLTINGTYKPVAFDSFGDGPRGDDIWFQAAGAARDPFWDYIDGVRVDGGTQALDVVTDWTVTTGDLFGDGQEDADMFNSAAGEVLWDFTFFDDDFQIVEYRDAGAPAAAAAGAAGSRTVQAGEAQPRTR